MSTTVPKAVREQLKRAEELQKQQYENQDTDTALNIATDNPKPQDELNAEEQIAKPNGEHKAQEALEHNETLEGQYQKLQQAHKALQGKYNAEVPRLNDQLRELKQKLEQAQKQVEQANSQADDAKKRLGEQLAGVRKEYGDDLADVIAGVAEKQRTQDTGSADQEQERFWRNLLRRVPDFNAVNSSPDFVQWLQSPSLTTGLSYQQELNEAGADLDVGAVVEIVMAFKKTQQKQAVQIEQVAAQVTPKRGQNSRVEQETTYTVEDWTKLQNDILKGRYRGREAEAKALEVKIHKALTSE